MRPLAFHDRYPETGYWHLNDDVPEAYGELSELVYGPVYDLAVTLKERTIDLAMYDRSHHEST